MNRFIAPSLLAADFADLRRDIEIINGSEADFFHLDIMDGVFVPNISFGIPVTAAIKKYAEKPLDVHLMIVNPERYLRHFRDAGADILTVHVEACNHLHRVVEEIRELGMKAGVSLNPHTPAEMIREILPYVDQVLIMSVNPGFGGQQFIPGSFNKVSSVRDMIIRTGSNARIEIDGGIDLSLAALLYQAGVNILVAGSAIFRAENIARAIHDLKHA